jgi:hypothetical protein
VNGAERRVTAAELLALAARHGLRASRRLITDWVSLGLLDRPYHPGLGRSRGSEQGTWSLAQAQLFIDLLALRQRPQNPIKHVAALTNVPVAGWLWMNDDSDVPLRQVRRALATWCGKNRSRAGASKAQARKVARAIAEQVDNPQASARDRNELRRLLETMVHEQRFDPEPVRVAVERVFDPRGVERQIGPKEAKVAAATYARLLEAQATGYLHLETFSDQEFEDARLIYLHSRPDYAAQQPRLASDPQRGLLRFEEPTPNDILNNACRDLLLLLGMGRLGADRTAQLAADREKKGDPQKKKQQAAAP